MSFNATLESSSLLARHRDAPKAEPNRTAAVFALSERPRSATKRKRQRRAGYGERDSTPISKKAAGLPEFVNKLAHGEFRFHPDPERRSLPEGDFMRLLMRHDPTLRAFSRVLLPD